MSRAAVILAGLIFCLLASPVHACGQRENPCKVPLGEYYVALPKDSAAPRAAIVHFHGGGGDGFAIVEDQWMIGPMTARNYVVIAPQGLRRPPLGNGWTFRPDHLPGRDELAFLREVAADAVIRFNINRARVLVTGHSVGGSISWYIACRAAPGEFAAYAPVAGGFWRPHPESCNSPVKMLHTHGWDDPVVPLEGRTFRRPQFTAVQGDVMEGLQIWRKVNGCGAQAPARIERGEDYWSRIWDKCAPDTALHFVLWPGGHDVPGFWPKLAMDWFEAQQPLVQGAAKN